MATTTNYGWTTPDDTALVKDGASAIRTLGSSVDTTTKALNPSTTLGDIEYRSSTANTNTRLGIGSSGQVLTVSGGVPAWGTVAAGGTTILASGSLSGTATTISSISGSYIDLVLVIIGRVHGTANKAAAMRFNGDTGFNYYTSVTYGNDTGAGIATPPSDWLRTGGDAQATGTSYSQENIWIPNYASTAINKIAHMRSYTSNPSSPTLRHSIGYYASTSAITSISIMAESAATLTGGTYILYGVK